MTIPGQPLDVTDKLATNPFLDGPTQALVKAVARSISEVRQFKSIFLDSIDSYERLDYSLRQLPALRVYMLTYRKEQESHYINGEVMLDILWPADLRRDQLQNFPDIVSSALLQQFRRPLVFQKLRLEVPGLNELGKVFQVDKQLGMKWEDGWIPITEMRANFRIDLKIWDAYLESTCRTKEEPFERTLENLSQIASTLIPVRDDGTQDTGAEVKLTNLTGGT